jgi:hypothetical protein
MALVSIVSSVAWSAGCAPVSSDLQSARLAGTGRIEITPGATANTLHSDGESEGVQNHFGLQVATGISERIDLRFRYERIELDGEESSSLNGLGVGPKFSIVPDRLALNLPIGFAFGGEVDEASETFQFHPTVLGTLSLTPWLEMTGAAKAIIPLNQDDSDVLTAFNLGLGLGPDLARWVVRPEVGFVFNPGEEGYYRHLSLGFTYYADR